MIKHKRRERNYPCVVPNCLGRNSTAISLFTIPPEDIDAWCANLQINPTDVKTTTRVCSRHFEAEYKGAQKLKTGARPTIQLGKQATRLSYRINKTRLNPRKCCIEGCHVKQPPGKVYRFPEDPKRRQQWLSICDIKETAIDNKLKFICGKHFDSSSIAHFRLKKDALPLAQFRKNRKIKEAAVRTIQRKENVELNNDESDLSLDGLECQNFCNTCQHAEEYVVKYLEAERRCQEAEIRCQEAERRCQETERRCRETEIQLEEANAQHLIETLALRSQIDELAAELEKRRGFHSNDFKKLK